MSAAAAVIPDASLRERFLQTRRGLISGIGPMGFLASELAFNDRSSWVRELNLYLGENLKLIQSAFPNRLQHLQATYLT